MENIKISKVDNQILYTIYIKHTKFIQTPEGYDIEIDIDKLKLDLINFLNKKNNSK